MERILVSIGRDFGCPMEHDDYDSYLKHCAKRLSEIYNVRATVRLRQDAGDTQCLEWPDEVDPAEIESSIGTQLWDEWCRKPS